MNANERAIVKSALQQDLLLFTRYMFKARTGNKFIVNWHHEAIAEHLQAVKAGEIQNLIINIPPRYGKTELGIINFVPWCFLDNQACKFIHLSYSDALVADNSSQIRELVKHEAYQELNRLSFQPDADSKHLWKTNKAGGLYAAPTGGTITGFGAGQTGTDDFAGAILIDDPLKPDDAKSELMRGNINSRLVNTIMSRRNSRKTPIIIIMQRIHEEDMTGYALSGATGEDWKLLKLPALGEGNKPLWDLKHTAEELVRMQNSPDPTARMVFSGQYQQEPAPEEGIYFKREWIKTAHVLPAKETMRIYGGSDYAVTADGGDYTVHVVVGVDPEDRMYLLDMWRGQTSSDVWVESFCDLAKQWKPIEWAEETGQIKSGVGPFLERRMRERKAYTVRTQFPTRNDKAIRAQSIRGRMALQGLYVQEGAPFLAEFEKELLSFPAGKHDDQVDAMGLVGQLLDKIMAGVAAKPKDKPKRDRWDKVFSSSGDDEYSYKVV